MPHDVAYAKPPRDAQRSMVDSTFRQVLKDRRPMVQQMDDAQQLKGSIFDTPAHAAMRQEAGADPSGGMKGIIVPKRGWDRQFSPAELKAQALWGKYWPKLLEALKKDTRPDADYVLDLMNRQGMKGYTESVRSPISNKLQEPIKIAINPKTFGMETGIHEAQHAFAIRRNPAGGGNMPSRGSLEALHPDVRKAYIGMGGGDPAHAAVYLRADDAAKRLGLVPTRGSSLKDY